MKYTEFEMATAIEVLLSIAADHLTDEEYEVMLEKNPVMHEIHEFGPRGPIGSGLGKFGGHAIVTTGDPNGGE